MGGSGAHQPACRRPTGWIPYMSIALIWGPLARAKSPQQDAVRKAGPCSAAVSAAYADILSPAEFGSCVSSECLLSDVALAAGPHLTLHRASHVTPPLHQMQRRKADQSLACRTQDVSRCIWSSSDKSFLTRASCRNTRVARRLHTNIVYGVYRTVAQSIVPEVIRWRNVESSNSAILRTARDYNHVS